MSHLAVTARGRRAEEGMMAGAEGGWEFEWRDRLSKHTWARRRACASTQTTPTRPGSTFQTRHIKDNHRLPVTDMFSV